MVTHYQEKGSRERLTCFIYRNLTLQILIAGTIILWYDIVTVHHHYWIIILLSVLYSSNWMVTHHYNYSEYLYNIMVLQYYHCPSSSSNWMVTHYQEKGSRERSTRFTYRNLTLQILITGTIGTTVHHHYWIIILLSVL